MLALVPRLLSFSPSDTSFPPSHNTDYTAAKTLNCSTMPLSMEDNFKLLASYCLFDGNADKVANYMGITKNAVYVEMVTTAMKDD